MLIKIVETPLRNVLMLCDDQGNPLPNQCSTKLESGDVEGHSVFTVTFAVDGKRIKLVASE